MVIPRVRHGSTHNMDIDPNSVCFVERKQLVIVTVDLVGVLLLRDCVLARCLRCYIHEDEASYIRGQYSMIRCQQAESIRQKLILLTEWNSASPTRSSRDLKNDTPR